VDDATFHLQLNCSKSSNTESFLCLIVLDPQIFHQIS
jgi:hypothetical protein